jgi:DNA-binding beta-propeller fold protein YncE
MCRTEFTIPDGGVGALTRNFIVQKLLTNRGTMDVTESRTPPPTLSHVVERGNAISAVTSLGRKLFVVRCGQLEIQVYDADTLTLQRFLTVPHFRPPSYGLAACDEYYCVYVSEFNSNTVHRVELSGCNNVTRWTVPQSPAGLSVNSAHNVLVTCQQTCTYPCRLQEYTTDGILVRQFCLYPNMHNASHAVQLPGGQFVVSICTSLGSVVVVGPDGRLMQSYGQPMDASQTHGVMTFPKSLAVTKNGLVLVADFGNNRILLINPLRSTVIQQLPLAAEGGLNGPRGLCLDESRRRLYVGEWNLNFDSRILAFDNVVFRSEDASV